MRRLGMTENVAGAVLYRVSGAAKLGKRRRN